MPRVLQGDVRARILEAAHERLLYYGFRKTTIDEIAADAGVGKGTVYLYFDSKEDIALAILAQFKTKTVEKVREISEDRSLTVEERLKEMVTYPIVATQISASKSPASQEFLVAIRPHIVAKLRPLIEQETDLVAQVLMEGNRTGVFDIPDPLSAAQSIKRMVVGFYPPFPCVSEIDEVRSEIGKIVDLVIRGLRKSPC